MFSLNVVFDNIGGSFDYEDICRFIFRVFLGEVRKLLVKMFEKIIRKRRELGFFGFEFFRILSKRLRFLNVFWVVGVCRGRVCVIKVL